jgi:hypothetical protein
LLPGGAIASRGVCRRNRLSAELNWKHRQGGSRQQANDQLHWLPPNRMMVFLLIAAGSGEFFATDLVAIAIANENVLVALGDKLA